MLDPVLLNSIHNHAHNVRKWAERLQEDERLWNDDLGGLCAIASVKLKRVLDKNGVADVTLCVHDVDGECHCFVSVGRGKSKVIVDVTATQFDSSIDKVVVKTASIAENDRTFWQPTMRFRVLDSAPFKKYFKLWFIEQQPFDYFDESF